MTVTIIRKEYNCLANFKIIINIESVLIKAKKTSILLNIMVMLIAVILYSYCCHLNGPNQPTKQDVDFHALIRTHCGLIEFV